MSVGLSLKRSNCNIILVLGLWFLKGEVIERGGGATMFAEKGNC